MRCIGQVQGCQDQLQPVVSAPWGPAGLATASPPSQAEHDGPQPPHLHPAPLAQPVGAH